MPKISRFKLTSIQIDQMSKRLIKAVSSLKNVTAAESFFDDLLTYTEKIMLGKRFLIAILLEKDFSYAQISRVVKVSEATIASVNEKLQRGGRGFRTALMSLEKEEKIEQVLNSIFSVLKKATKPLSSKTSSGYYKWRYDK